MFLNSKREQTLVAELGCNSSPGLVSPMWLRTAASTFAGDSMLGSPSIEITDKRMASTPKIGRQRSSAFSCSLNTSCPGGCRMLMHTRPSGNTAWKQQKTKRNVKAKVEAKIIQDSWIQMDAPVSDSRNRYDAIDSEHVLGCIYRP